MDLPSQDKIKMLGEKETYKFFGYLEADSITQVEIKDKIKKEYLRGSRNLCLTKLSSRNPFKGINTWPYPSLDIRDPFWSGPEKNLSKWT